MDKERFFSQFTSNMKPSRSGFDKSHRTLFTCPSAAMLPVFCQHVVPSEKVTIDVSSFTRTLPLNQAAYVELNENVDFFYVPYRQLWSYWDSFYNQLVMEKSSRMYLASPSNRIPLRIPGISRKQVRDKILKSDSSVGKLKDDLGYPFYKSADRLLNLLGYGTSGLGKGSYADDPSNPWLDPGDAAANDFVVNLLPLQAYQKIYYDHYRNQFYENDDPFAYNIDSSTPTVVSSSTPVINLTDEQLRRMFKLHYKPLARDLYTNVLPSVLAGFTPTAIAFPSNADYYKTSNWLGLGTQTAGRHFVNGTPGAYSQNVHQAPVDSGSAFAGSEYTGNGSATGFYPRVNEDITDRAANTTVGNVFYNNDYSDDQVVGSVAAISSLADIRAMQSIEKLLYHLNHSKHTAKAQLESRFGVQIHDDRDTEVTYLGSYHNGIAVGEVVSTSDTQTSDGGAVLGDTAGTGKGFGRKNNIVDFYAKEAGIVMGIYYVVENPVYTGAALNPFNRKLECADFYHPQMDNLGMQPVMACDLVLRVDGSGTTARNQVLAWQYRYSEYKTDVDRVYGNFQNSDNSLATYVAPIRFPVGSSLEYDIYRLSHKPSTLDKVFTIAYNGDTSRDQFMVNLGFNVRTVAPMSLLGEPILGNL